jgi:hypothetical protein
MLFNNEKENMFFTDNFSKSKFSTFKNIFPTTKGKFGDAGRTVLLFRIEERLETFVLDFERPLPFFCGETDEVECEVVRVRFLFLDARADGMTISEFNNDDIY